MKNQTLLLSLFIALIALGASVEAGGEKVVHAGRKVRKESRMLKSDKGTKSTKTPKVKSTKAPKVKSTKAPKVKSTKAPKVDPPASSGNQARSSLAIASAVAGVIWFAL